jgi:predicted dehydrogenase
VERGREWAEEMHCRFEPDYDRIISDPEIDAVIITAGTTSHAKLIISAARHKKHVFTEKALTVSPDEAVAIREAVRDSGIHFTISDPVERPELVYAKKLIDAGTFGEITEIRYRIGHEFGLTDPDLMSRYYDRSEAGGGCMFDMGHHAVHVLLWMLGRPSSVTGVFSEFTAAGKRNHVDDMGIAVFSYASGAVGVAETGWLYAGGQNSFEVYGTNGLLRFDQDGLRFRTMNQADWTRPEPQDLPGPAEYPLRYWMESILRDTDDGRYNVDDAVTLVEMISAAYASDGRQQVIEYK